MAKTKLILLFLFYSLFHLNNIYCQTMVSGNISGTWSTEGNPYLVIDNCTIQKGELLKIQPGVEVIIGDSLSISAFGRIEAIGNHKDPIKFKAPNEDVYWDKIEVNYNGEISEFTYCDFSNANIAIYLKMVGKITDTMITKIQNCSFTKCDSSGLYGYVYGNSTYSWGGMWSHYPHLNPIIKNCTFDNLANGCIFYIRGWGAVYAPTTRGYTSPIILNNIFKNITNTVLKLEAGSYAGSSEPTFINNTIYDCENGIATQEPYDVKIKNNLFTNSGTVIQRTNDLSSTLSYNCFFNNTINFIGYPESYGLLVMQNHNNDPCDIAFNIYNEPLYNDTVSFTLSNDSPCIDAGSPDSSLLDVKFPPSLGSVINDIGAYGGQEAGNWLDTVLNLTNIESYKNNNILLSQNYPNPFKSITKIEYELSYSDFVNLAIFNISGQKIKDLVNQKQTAGRYQVVWNGTDQKGKSIPNGLYFYKISSGDFLKVKKMFFIR
ncbi:MAG: T9SS type A sorting domain-containing protein [Bacteroidetes bacterium]|nr:T9SS type A sorting domain-containing protein [Bacteroidota bacterium]